MWKNQGGLLCYLVACSSIGLGWDSQTAYSCDDLYQITAQKFYLVCGWPFELKKDFMPLDLVDLAGYTEG